MFHTTQPISDANASHAPRHCGNHLAPSRHATADANARIVQAQGNLRACVLRTPLRIQEANWTMREFLPDPAWSLPEVIARRARRNPEDSALHVVGFDGRVPSATSLSFGELTNRTQRAAQLLIMRGVGKHDRVILSVVKPDQFLPFFLAAQCLGAIPVPVPAITELPHQAYSVRIRSVVGDALPKVVVLDDVRALDVVGSTWHQSMDAIESGHLQCESLEGQVDLCWSCEPHEIAFLQYTSGSTGSPKGVVVLHHNLIANMRAMIEGLRLGPQDRLFSWLPLFHDMGLVAGLLMGAYAGVSAYVTSPRHFVARPDSWLRAISTFQATFSPAPNFAFHILARRVPDSALEGIDLRSWRLACDGAEPIDAATARAFVRRFKPFGFDETSFRAVYGLAECTLASAIPEFESRTCFDCVDREALAIDGVAAPRAEGDAGTATYVAVGTAVPGHGVRIVEPGTDRPLPERRLGEVEVRGPSVTPLYFHQLLAGVEPREALHTGDLGYIADGQLYIVDRLKDILIIAGRKFAPRDIENVVAEVPGMRRGGVVAFASRGSDGSAGLILVVAPDPRAHTDSDAILRAVRLTVFDHFGLAPADIVLVRPADIPKTTSGKLARAACRAVYQNSDGCAWKKSLQGSKAQECRHKKRFSNE